MHRIFCTTVLAVPLSDNAGLASVDVWNFIVSKSVSNSGLLWCRVVKSIDRNDLITVSHPDFHVGFGTR
jgi:hypothetical protein